MSDRLDIPVAIPPIDGSAPHARAGPADASPSERRIWEGRSSQWSNFDVFVQNAALLALIVGALVAASLRPEPAALLEKAYRPVMLAVGALCVIPLLRVTWAVLLLGTTRYEVTSERLRMRHGVFSRTWEELELYRVKDATLHQPFLYRLVGLSSISLVTSDRTHPYVSIPAVADGETLREHLRDCIERQRARRGVRELDT